MVKKMIAGSLVLTLLVACSPTAQKPEDGVMVGGSMMVASRTIVENAMEADNLIMLVSAVESADLVDTLKGPGPFTVFAPTDTAFNELPAGTLSILQEPQNIETLRGILTYHVVPGAIMAADLRDGQMLTTVNGAVLKVRIKDGEAYVNDARITIADVPASNGVVYVVDAVLLPPDDAMNDGAMMDSNSSVVGKHAVEMMLDGGKDAMMQKSVGAMLEEQTTSEDSMMQNDPEAQKDMLMKNADAMDAGATMSEPPAPTKTTYAPYAPGVIGNGKPSVLFFHAAWCPVCIGTDQDLAGWYPSTTIPYSVYKVDYDTQKDLVKQYGVTYQHTFVKLDGEGNVIKVLNTPDSATLEKFLKS